MLVRQHLQKEITMYEQVEEMKRILETMLLDERLFELVAQIMKKSHTALVKAGFTEEQATMIVANQGTGIK